MVDATELEQLLAKFQNKNLLSRIASNSFKTALEQQATYTVKNTHFKNGTGVTLGALDTEVNGLSGELFVEKAKVPYIEYVYDGTGIYGPRKKMIDLAPKNKEALSWVSGNDRFFSRGHQSKGQKPNPFIETAYEKNLKTFLNWYSEDMTEELQEAL